MFYLIKKEKYSDLNGTIQYKGIFYVFNNKYYIIGKLDKKGKLIKLTSNDFKVLEIFCFPYKTLDLDKKIKENKDYYRYIIERTKNFCNYGSLQYKKNFYFL